MEGQMGAINDAFKGKMTAEDEKRPTLWHKRVKRRVGDHPDRATG